MRGYTNSMTNKTQSATGKTQIKIDSELVAKALEADGGRHVTAVGLVRSLLADVIESAAEHEERFGHPRIDAGP